jgi:hypothetical protein
MRGVTVIFNSDEDLEDIQNGNDTDVDHEESEDKEPEVTTMMLSDEVSSSTGLLKLIQLIPS